MKRRVFTLSHIGNGWQCTAKGSRAVGWGSTADLAIKSWKQQYNRTPCVHCGKSRNDHHDMVHCFGKNGTAKFMSLEETYRPSFWRQR